MLWIGALVSLGSAVFGGLRSAETGKQQAKAASDIEAKNKFKQYKRPKEYGTGLGIAQQMAYSPNFAGRGYMEEQNQATTANALRGINEMGLGGAESGALMSNLYSQQQEGAQQIGVMGAEQQNAGLLQLLQQLQVGGQYSDQEFQYNVAQPYERGASAASALRGASMANKDNATQSITNSIGAMGYGLMTTGGAFNKKGDTTVNDVMGKYGNQEAQNLNGGAFPKTFGGGFGGQTFQGGAKSLNSGIQGLGDLNNISGADLMKYFQFFNIGGGVQNLGG